MKARICFFVLCVVFVVTNTVRAENKTVEEVDAKSYILMEQSTGRVLAEDKADEKLPIASVTKIMTMLLIMEEIENKTLKWDDLVTVSDNAMSYGGSTMFLESGEQLPVSDMLKGIAVASANDGCVAMAEHIAGSESEFVTKMNEKAAQLGMNNTNFVNTNGLDEENHYSSARDVAIMSRELLRYPEIIKYTSIWTDELRGGKFQLANTNKLVRFYSGANGLKTGSTSAALCCLSASAKRDDMQLIAVVLGSPTSDKRFSSARALLDYGFANYKIRKLISEGEELCDVDIVNGVDETIKGIAKESKTYLSEKSNKDDVQKRVFVNSDLTAPIKKGDNLGKMEFSINGKTIDSVDIVASCDVEKKGVAQIIRDIAIGFL